MEIDASGLIDAHISGKRNKMTSKRHADQMLQACSVIAHYSFSKQHQKAVSFTEEQGATVHNNTQ